MTYRLAIVSDVQALVDPEHFCAGRDMLWDRPDGDGRSNGQQRQSQQLAAAIDNRSHGGGGGVTGT